MQPSVLKRGISWPTGRPGFVGEIVVLDFSTQPLCVENHLFVGDTYPLVMTNSSPWLSHGP